MLSMNCPNFSNESVRNDFNEIITLLGGTQMSIDEFRSPELRNSRLADDFNAMERAYELWDQYNGDMAKIKDNLSQTYIDNIEPTTKIGTTADSLSVFDMLIQKMQKVLPSIQVNWVSKSEVPAEYQNQPAYRIGIDIYFIEENITLDSPMHEFGHLWIDIIELSDQNLYNEIMTGIDEMIANNNPIAIAVKNNGQNLAETALRKEIFSKMMGFTSIGKIRNYAKQNNIQISDTILNRTATFIKNVMRKVSNLISSVFFNNVNVQMTDTVDNVIEKLIDDVIYGTNKISSKEGVDFVFEQNPELANAVYEALGFLYTPLTNEDKIKIDNKVKEELAVFNRLLTLTKKNNFNEAYDVLADRIIEAEKDVNRREEYIELLKFQEHINTYYGYLINDINDKTATDTKITDVINEIKKQSEKDKTRRKRNQITPQQKQQAQQLYSQYLDTVFPDSKVKDIVYHGSPNKIETFDKARQYVSNTGFFTSNNIEHAKTFSLALPGNSPTIHSLIINTSNPKQEIFTPALGLVENKPQAINRIKTEGYDAAIFDTKDFGFKIMEYVLFEPEQIHILGSKQDIEGFKKFVKKERTQYQRLNEPLVNYHFKAVDALMKNIVKIRQWEANKSVDENTLYKKIAELGIPKEQLSLIRESEGNTVEEKIATFAAKYSYTVEIGTSKVEPVTKEIMENEKDTYFDSKFYSNLTVPGGINYKENRIITPAIVPSIKGHPQFAQDNDIGWFRSDEQYITEQIEYADGTFNEGTYDTKTRRILEVQSDLFQKGRDKSDLTKDTNVPYDLFEELYIESQTQGWTKEQFEKEKVKLIEEYGLKDKVKSENQFLQLLNKDGNWVSFFIKSIVQDSARKGYEKVLFPAGETAAKIEGHTTIAREIERNAENIKEQQQWVTKFETEDRFKIPGPKGTYFGYIVGKGQGQPFLTYAEALEYTKSGLVELEQYESSLKTEGMAKLKPIEGFYEVRVKNTLEKIYGKQNVNRITDEYGNDWFEIVITEEMRTEPIQLQVSESIPTEATLELATLEAIADKLSERTGVPYRITELADAAKELGVEEKNVPIAYFTGQEVVFVNSNKLQNDTPFHEFAHPFVDVICKRNTPLFGNLKKKLAGSPAGQEIIEEVKRKYPELVVNGELIENGWKEAITTALGRMAATDSLDVAPENRGLWGVIQTLIKAIQNFINRYMLGEGINPISLSANTSFRELADILSISEQSIILNKKELNTRIQKQVAGAAPGFRTNEMAKTLVPSDINEELEIIKNRKETNFNFQPASNISDIKHLILGSEESVFENITDEEFAKNLFTSCVSISSLSGKNQFVYGPIIRELNGTTPDEVIAEIKKDIIPEVKEFDSNFTKKFAKYVIDVSTKNIDPETAGKDLYPKSNINAGYFRKLYDGLNLYDGVVGAYTFDELSNSNNATLKAISTELVSGNYIAIVHKIDGSDVEVTLVDILPSKSNNVIDKYRNKKNVFKNFIKSDAKASSMGVTLKHSSVTARQITNGFVAKSMSINAKKNGVTVKFRGFGTLGRAGSKHAYIQVADINELAENMNVLKEVPEFLAKLNPDTQEIVKSDEDIAVMQSSLEKLVRFLESKKYTTTGRQIQSENDIKTLKTGTPSDKKYIITKLLSKMSIDDKNTQEYKLLSMALAEYHLSQYKNSNRLDDMSFLSSHFMNPHNFQSDLLQIFNKEYYIAKGIVVDASVKWQKSVNPLVQAIIKKRTDYAIRSRIQDMGSKIFEHLYKKVKGVDENGNEIDIIIPGEIHWAKNNGTKEHPSWQFFDQNTKDLYNQGVLDDNDLLYTEMVLDQVEDLFTLLEYEAHKYDKVRDATDGRYVDYSMEDARRYTKATLTRGFVPVMDKTANEMLATGNPGESIKRLYDNVTNPNVIFEDLIERGREMDEVKNVFSSQLDKDTRLANYGIAIKNGQYVVTNKDLYNKMGTNVDRIMAVFTLAENRSAEYSERLVPLRNSINAIFSVYNDMGKDQRFNKEALEYLSNMLLDQKTVNTKEGKGKFAKIVDSSGVLLTFAHIFMKFTLFFKSVVWNNTRDIIISTSNAVAQNGNYNTLDWLKAQKEVALHANHVYTLARDMQIIDRSEWDMVSNPLLVKSDRNILQTWFGFVPNYLSDSHARIVTMVAQMMRDGTWKAHKFDDETGEWSYDETLDKRMYDENGQITPEGKVLKEAIKADLVDQGLMKKDDNELTRGYDYQDAARLKYLSDKYVIGSYDQNSKSLAAQFSWMRMIMKFRIFSSDRLQNAGLFMEGRSSIAEGKRVVYKDKDGNLVSKREMAEIEGAWQSWRKVARLLISLRNKENTKKVLAEMNPSTKANIARSLIQIVMFYAIQGAILGFGDDDDDKKDKRRRAYLQRQWGWLYSDIMTTNIVYDFYRNPMPVLDNIISFVNASEELVTTGRVNKELMNFVPGTAIWKDYKYIESIFAGEEEYYENKKIEAKKKRQRAKQ
jgi:hypothetical protein